MPLKGRKLWHKLQPFIEKRGILCALDRTLFSVLCDLWARYLENDGKLAADGLVTVGSKGGKKPHPLVAVQASVTRELISLAKEYGLTPMSRKQLGIEEQADIGEDNEFERFLAGRYTRN